MNATRKEEVLAQARSEAREMYEAFDFGVEVFGELKEIYEGLAGHSVSSTVLMTLEARRNLEMIDQVDLSKVWLTDKELEIVRAIAADQGVDQATAQMIGHKIDVLSSEDPPSVQSVLSQLSGSMV